MISQEKLIINQEGCEFVETAIGMHIRKESSGLNQYCVNAVLVHQPTDKHH